MDSASQLDSAIPELGLAGGRVNVIVPSNLAEQLVCVCMGSLCVKSCFHVRAQMPHGFLSEIRSGMPRPMTRAQQTQGWYDDAMKQWNKRKDDLSKEMTQEEQLYGSNNNRASYKKMKERSQQLDYNKAMIEDTKELMDYVEEPLLLITTHRPLSNALGNPLVWDINMWRQIVCEKGNRMLHLIDGHTMSIAAWDTATINQIGECVHEYHSIAYLSKSAKQDIRRSSVRHSAVPVCSSLIKRVSSVTSIYLRGGSAVSSTTPGLATLWSHASLAVGRTRPCAHHLPCGCTTRRSTSATPTSSSSTTS